ncbi:sugar phosphate isomerase/epimerase [Ruminococcaceae bacterium OttesenSCG-928-O06]|nr:sugar phosphate isomerase/epimerase [Ruminococcaceae bacterium OttesenSCG-928-O06]
MKKIDISQFCVLSAPFLHHTLEYGLDAIAANGFTHVELWGASPHYCLDDYDAAGRKRRIQEINAMLAARGLHMPVFYPEQVRQYPINIASPNRTIREKSLGIMRQYMQDAVAFGAGTMMLAPGWAFVDSFCEDDVKRAQEAVCLLAEEAKPLGLQLAMEELDATSTLLVQDMEALAGFVGTSGVGACMDVPLATTRGGSVGAYYSTFGSLAHVHLCGYGKDGYMPLGTGELDVAAILAQLMEKGYTGKISLSLWGAIYYPDPDAALRACRIWLENCALVAV